MFTIIYKARNALLNRNDFEFVLIIGFDSGSAYNCLLKCYLNITNIITNNITNNM